jgi:serine/threonine protein kinase
LERQSDMAITLLGSRYRVVREIGAGGMGRVFQAVDTQTGRAVAAKVMIASSEENLDALLRFYQEGAVLATLKHPNIVEVSGTFLEEGVCSIVMELLEGPSLDELLAAERLPLPRVKLLVDQIAGALSYAHGRGIVHRDIKPSNIMVIGDDRVKVTDFGIARVLQGGTRNTTTGMSIGTPLYMSPEQIEAERVDGRSDIYSLGVVLYQMVVGRPPFDGHDPLSIAFKHVHRAPPPPSELNPDVPKDWEQVILKMLAKVPAMRYASAAEVQEAIRPLSERPGMLRAGKPVHDAQGAETAKTPDLGGSGDNDAGPIRGDAPRVRPPKYWTRPWAFGTGIAALAAVLAIVLVIYHSETRTSHPPATNRLHAGKFLAQFGPFNDPEGVTVDSKRNIYVAVWGDNKIEKLASTGQLLATWGSAGSASGQFNGPAGMALDSQGNIYVADSANNRIQKLSSNGTPQMSVGGPAAGSSRGAFNGVHGMAVDEVGNMYAADYGNNRIVKLSSGGRVLGTWGGTKPGSGPGQFDQPVGVAVDSFGHVYVADFNNNRIEKLSTDGRYLQQFRHFGSGVENVRPHGVAVDSKGNIYVADYQNNKVEVLAANGAPVAAWGGTGVGHGEFDHPVSIWVDGAGTIYVGDKDNHRIQKFAPIQ